MTYYCCAEMEREVLVHYNTLNCPCQAGIAVGCCAGSLIFYDKPQNTYGIKYHDGGTSFQLISYCPWCGGWLGNRTTIDGKPIDANGAVTLQEKAK